jgi:hypothetical protein
MTDDDTTRETLREMSHTNPYTNRSFGETQTYGRGTVVAADGGEANGVSRASSGERTESDGGDAAATPDEGDDNPVTDGGSPETLGEVDHTPPGETEGAHRAYERGLEGKDDVQ